MYVVAIKDTKSWIGDSPAEIAMIGFWNLIVVWLKVSKIYSLTLYCLLLTVLQVAHSLEVFPGMGFTRWHRSSGKYGPMYGE